MLEYLYGLKFRNFFIADHPLSAWSGPCQNNRFDKAHRQTFGPCLEIEMEVEVELDIVAAAVTLPYTRISVFAFMEHFCGKPHCNYVNLTGSTVFSTDGEFLETMHRLLLTMTDGVCSGLQGNVQEHVVIGVVYIYNYFCTTS